MSIKQKNEGLAQGHQALNGRVRTKPCSAPSKYQTFHYCTYLEDLETPLCACVFVCMWGRAGRGAPLLIVFYNVLII